MLATLLPGVLTTQHPPRQTPGSKPNCQAWVGKGIDRRMWSKGLGNCNMEYMANKCGVTMHCDTAHGVRLEWVFLVYHPGVSPDPSKLPVFGALGQI